MDAGASVQLLQELDRQLDLVPSVKQDATTNSKSPRGEVIITLCDQSDPHRLLLSSLRENLLECLKLPYDEQRRESSRPLELPIWKILAFFEPSWFIDPEAAKEASRARLSLHAKYETSALSRSSLWDDQKIRDWSSAEDSSLIILQGSFKTRDILEQAAIVLIDHLVKQDQRVAWLLDPGTYYGGNLLELPNWGFSGILKQIVVHILQQDTSFNSLDRLAMLVELFRAASSPKDWFRVLEVVIPPRTQLYMILNLGALRSDNDEAQCFLDTFHKLFHKLTANRGSAVKAMLLTPYSVEKEEPLSSVPVVRIHPPREESATIKRQSLMGLPILRKSKED